MRFATITLLAAFRSIMLSERLALVELVIPVVVVFATTAQLRAHYRNLMRVAPVFMALVVFVVFALGEFFRSWAFYRPLYDGPYLQFAFERFMGYYTTAINNAAVYYYFLPVYPLRHSFQALFELPVLGRLVSTNYAVVFGDNLTVHDHLYLLQKYANPEFNNVPLIGALVNEFSVFLAPAVAFVLGVLSVSLYRGFLRGRLIGILVYPSWYVGILEIPRIYYWASVRYFPALALLATTLFAFALAKKMIRTSSRRRVLTDRSGTSREEIVR
jgi:hypothetical protein